MIDTTRNLARKLGCQTSHVHFESSGRQLHTGDAPLTVRLARSREDPIRTSGTQNVVLEAPSFHIAPAVTGSLVSMGPVRLQFASAGVCALDGHLDAPGALAHALLGRRKFRAADRPGDVERSNFRNAIIALDGERAGASRREKSTFV